MNKSKISVLPATVIALAAMGCHDVEGPVARSLPVPSHLSRTVVGPPDATFSVPAVRGSPAPTNTYLMQFPWDTWVTIEATGTVQLNALPPIYGASPNYVYPGGPVAATG